MEINKYPRLCGGTFFVLVLQALRQRMKVRQHYKGERDGLSDPEVLMGLIKVINPGYQEVKVEAIKTKTNDYKACKTSSSPYFPFGDTQDLSTFDSRIQNDYASALRNMNEFIESYLDLNESVGKTKQLALALMDSVIKDESILEDERLYISEDGLPVKKSDIRQMRRICLQSFVLGVWHYAVVHRKDNTVGKETYDIWCPSTGGGPRIYKGNMGSDIKGVEVYQTEIQEEQEMEFEQVVEPQIEAEIIDEAPQQQTVQQNVNNPFVFNFTQNGNNNTQIGHIENYYAGNKGGQDDKQ